MDFGVCLLGVIPVRKEPSDRSEMVSQLLFGDLVIINAKQDNWLETVSLFDNYEGWIDGKQVRIISGKEFERLKKHPQSVASGLINLITQSQTDVSFMVPAGSTIYNNVKGAFKIDGIDYNYQGDLLPAHPDNVSADQIIATGKMFLSAPYLWGGKTVFGIDCSGLVQVVYKMAGIQMLRDANQQAEQGILISFLEEATPGDLLFFDNDEGRIVHVGILIENSRILHASDAVRIDLVDTHGIYHQEKDLYTHNLRLIRRVI